MNLLRSFSVMAFALVLVSIAAYCAAERSVELLAVAGTLAALSWYVTEGPRGRTLPRWASSGLVIAVAVGSVADFFLHPGDLPSVLGRFSVGLTLVKLYDRRTARDHAQLMGLSLLLILVGCLRSQDLLFGVFVVLFAALGLYVLMLYQLFAAHEQVTAERRRGLAIRTDLPPPPAIAPTIGRLVVPQFRGLVAMIAIACAVLAAALFVIFPRSLGPATTLLGGQRRTVGGQSEEINLDAGTRITDSRRVAFELDITDAAGRPVRLAEPLLLRGAVLDDYDDGRWRSSIASGTLVSSDGRSPGWLVPPADVTDPLTLHFRFASPTRMLFSPYVPVAVQPERPRRLSLRPDFQTLHVGSDEPPVWTCTLLAETNPSSIVVGALSRGSDSSPNGRRFNVSAPQSAVDAVTQLARAVLADAGMGTSRWGDRGAWNKKAAETLAAYLRGGDFSYTLDVRDVVRRGEDPIAEFLFRSRRGHCEFFATGLAALCHTVGIDARVVTGYVVAGTGNAGRYLVLESAAHAWVEVPVDDGMFHAVDPTPPSELARTGATDGTLAERAGWVLQRLDGMWTSRVVQFDARSQAELLDALGSGWTRRVSTTARATVDWMAQVNRAFYFGPAGYIWLGIVALAAVIAFVALFRAFRRYRALRRALGLGESGTAGRHRLFLQLGFYLDLLIAMERGGLPKPQWQPPRDFAQSLAGEHPKVATLVAGVTDLYYRSRYAGEVLSREEMARARGMVGELRACLRAEGDGVGSR